VSESHYVSPFGMEVNNGMEMDKDKLHVAYELLSSTGGFNERWYDHDDVKEKLSKRFPELAWHEVVEYFNKAKELREAAYDVGSSLWDKRIREADGPCVLKERKPGFSDKTYELAFRDGCHESMW